MSQSKQKRGPYMSKINDVIKEYINVRKIYKKTYLAKITLSLSVRKALIEISDLIPHKT
jgi:hypothetical protein